VPNVKKPRKSFWAQAMELLGDVGQLEAHFGLLEIVLISTQDRCPICAEYAIYLEIILGAPARTPR
jgi:hypothetical protein